jgi:hypothetical protein
MGSVGSNILLSLWAAFCEASFTKASDEKLSGAKSKRILVAFWSLMVKEDALTGFQLWIGV